MLPILFALRRIRRMKAYDPVKARHRRGVLRVCAFGAAVSLAVGTVAGYSSARTQVSENSFEVGRQLAGLGDLLKDGHRISLNGERIWVASGHTEQDPKVVMDRFEAHCRSTQGASADAWRQIASGSEPLKRVKDGNNLFTWVRQGNDDEGVVMCLSKTSFQNADGMQAALDFARTSDLGHLGALRYAYIRKSKSGSGTSIVLAWTEDHFRIGHMTAQDGQDVPGTDSVMAPRPKGDSVRLLSAHLDGTPYGAHVYQSSMGSPHEVFAYYDEEMSARGYKPLRDPMNKDAGRGYMKDGLIVSVSTTEDPNGGTVVTIGDLGAPDYESAPKLTLPGAKK